MEGEMKMKKGIIFCIVSIMLLSVFSIAADKPEPSKQLEKEPSVVDEKFCEKLNENILSLNKDWKDAVTIDVEDELVFKVKFFPPELNKIESNYASLSEIEISEKDTESAENCANKFSQTLNKAYEKIKDQPFVDHYSLLVCRTFKEVDLKSAYYTGEAKTPFEKKKEQVLFEGEFLVGDRLEFNQAVELIESGDYHEGIKKLREFIKNNPDSPLVFDAHIRISEVFEDISNQIKQEIKPPLPDYGYRDRAAFEKIRTLISMGQKQNAMAEIKKFKKAFPLSPINEKILGIKM